NPLAALEESRRLAPRYETENVVETFSLAVLQINRLPIRTPLIHEIEGSSRGDEAGWFSSRASRLRVSSTSFVPNHGSREAAKTRSRNISHCGDGRGFGDYGFIDFISAADLALSRELNLGRRK
ncbi:MAG: hypothetical protein Q7S40_07520, partial [Opitutaceae bacterium]|nr:hypothetical protein [Opitutaceae bacterium]